MAEDIPRSTLQGQIQTLYIVTHSAGGWEGPSPQLTSAPSSETLHPPRPRPQMLNRDGHVTKGRQPDSLPPGIWDWESVFRNHELVQLNLRWGGLRCWGATAATSCTGRRPRLASCKQTPAQSRVCGRETLLPVLCGYLWFTHTHTRTHARTCTCTRTQTHTHTESDDLSIDPELPDLWVHLGESEDCTQIKN